MAWAQNSKKPTASTEEEKTAKQLAIEAAEAADPTLIEFDRMKPETVAKIKTLVNEASSLLPGVRIQEALARLNEADFLGQEKLFVVKNLKGACFTKIRMFPEARKEFEAALKLHPHSFQAKFNLAELDFVEAGQMEREGKSEVKEQWAKALKAFESLQDARGVDESTRKLMQFKRVICLLKLGKRADAEALVSTFSYIDDEPIYQMGHAALEFDKNNRQGAQEWIDEANRIWRTSPQSIVVYMDSFIEVGWIDAMIN